MSACDHVMQAIASGALKTVAGVPLNRFTSQEAVLPLLEMIAVSARPEAYAEALGAVDEARALQEEYEHLASLPAPLLAEVQRMKEVRTRLQDLGVTVE